MANSTKIVKKANSFLVLSAIRKQRLITVEEIVDATGLSRPTVLSILKKLLNDEIVTASGLAQTDIGRHPVQYTLNATNRYAIGVDVDGPPVNLVVSDLTGEVLYSTVWSIDLADRAEDIVAAILAELDKAVATLGIGYDRVLGIGIGLPAVVDIAANATVRISRLARWNNYPVSEAIAQHTGVKVSVRNDAHLLGMAEHTLLGDTENSLYIVHRSGIGMAATIGNQSYEGAMGNSGYIGHSTLIANGRACDCGSHGCFEAYCSKRAIVSDFAARSGEQVKYSVILQRAHAGEAAACEVLAQAGELLGIAVANFIKSFEIYHIVLGNMECAADHPFFQAIVDSTNRHLSNYTNRAPRIVGGCLTQENFGLGGCHLILSKFFAHPKLRLQ